MPFYLRIDIYTPAGEHVRRLYEGASSASPDGFALQAPPLGPDTLTLPGVLAGGGSVILWRQDNDGGQTVSSGDYVLKIESADSFGTTTSWTRTLKVLGVPGQADLILYNAAGEAVRHYDTAALGLDPVDFGRSLPGGVELKGRNGAISLLPFDGLDDRGQTLGGGNYEWVLHWSDAGGSHTATRSVLKVPEPQAEPLAAAMLEQNPVPPGRPLAVRYSPCACQVRASVHELSGGLVAEGADLVGAGRLVIDLPGSAGGIYLLRLRATGAGLRPSERVLKAALLR